VNIATSEAQANTPPQLFIDATLSQLPASMTAVATEVLTINDYPTGKIELVSDLEGITVHQLIYIIQHETTVWIVTYSTGDTEFEQRLPEFELSINSFKVND
jgi:hypothetical protein